MILTAEQVRLWGCLCLVCVPFCAFPVWFRCISLPFNNVLYCIQNLQAVLEHILLSFRVHLDKGLWCHTERASLMWVNQPQPPSPPPLPTPHTQAVHHFLSSTQTSSDPEDRCRHLILSRWLEQRTPAADGLPSRPGWDMTRPQAFRSREQQTSQTERKWIPQRYLKTSSDVKQSVTG